MLKRPKRRVAIRIDMTPMVDVAFLLLIFYMSTTQFKPPETKNVALPSSHQKAKLPDKDLVKVTVTKDDSIFVDYIEVREEKSADGSTFEVPTRVYEEATPATIASVINTIRLRNPRVFVVIRADKDTDYGTMEAMMKTMKENQLNRFQLLTEFEEEAEAS